MKKIILSFICITIMLLTLSMEILAVEKTIDVTLDQEYTNCVFQITWENTNEKAEISIKSPKGDQFGLQDTPDQVQISEGRTLINVGSANPGVWKVTIRGENLGKVDISGGQLPGMMEIEEFEVKKVENGYRANWKVTDSPEILDIQIYADQDGKGFDGKEVASFKGNPIGEETFQLSGVDNGNYYFYIRISDPSGIFNRKYTKDVLTYLDINSPNKLEDVKARMLNQEVYLTWNIEEIRNFKIMIFDPLTKELIWEEETNEGSYLWPVPEDMEKVFVGVASFDYKQLGQYDLIEVFTKNIPIAQVIYPDEEISNMKTILVQVKFDGDYFITAALNDEILIDEDKEQGDYRIDLIDGENTIVFLVTDQKGNMATYTKELYIDSTPPQLSINQDINKTTTNDSYVYLEGYTEASAILTINNQEV